MTMHDCWIVEILLGYDCMVYPHIMKCCWIVHILLGRICAGLHGLSSYQEKFGIVQILLGRICAGLHGLSSYQEMLLDSSNF